MTKRILVDCDGVLADFTGALCKELHKEGHGSWTDEHLTTWELKACFPTKSHSAIERIMTRPGFFASIPRYPGAQSFIKDLRKRGDVSAVTVVTGKAQQERYDWLCSLGFQDHEIVLVVAGFVGEITEVELGFFDDRLGLFLVFRSGRVGARNVLRLRSAVRGGQFADRIDIRRRQHLVPRKVELGQ